jgi:Abnormal spindle-like microcephaly-assoc'd, ASPM-SPD-2-Hydin
VNPHRIGFGGLLSIALALSASAQTVPSQSTSPSFVLSYVFPSNQNVVSLQPGGSIPFPATLVGATAQAALTLTNEGSGPGSVTAITSSGSAFVLQGTPMLPATVNAGLALTVEVLYQPTSVGTSTGQITITFASGAPVTINLTGSGTSPSFTYQLLGTNPLVTVSPGGTITLPSANLGQTTSVTLQVLNSGNASGTVSSISLVGAGFGLSTVVVPQTLAPGLSLTFTVSFTPTQPGTVTGTLIINSTTFTLSGVGLGPLLTFSYMAGGTTITLAGTNNTVVFSPVEISQSSQVTLEVENTGTLPATISNIGVQQTGGPFSLSGQPPLPVTLAPNADFRIVITFTPTTLGYSNTNLLFDAATIALEGSGTQPPPLPSYTITGPSGNATPMTQPTIGLTLASPYPVEISGTLTISVAGTLPADPGVQFMTGGATVSFTIPANQTNAVFGAQGTQLGMQTGTVASKITITPTFATQAGNVPITPAAPEVLQFAVAPAAPGLIAIQLTGQSTTGFTIQVTGFTTTRSLTSLVVQFAISAGFSMPTSQFTIDASSISTIWFESSASDAYGSQFTIAVPFTFQGVAPKGLTILSAISSVSVTANNAIGSSNSVQATLQ